MNATVRFAKSFAIFVSFRFLWALKRVLYAALSTEIEDQNISYLENFQLFSFADKRDSIFGCYWVSIYTL